jgi:hypothetical protein
VNSECGRARTGREGHPLPHCPGGQGSRYPGRPGDCPPVRENAVIQAAILAAILTAIPLATPAVTLTAILTVRVVVWIVAIRAAPGAVGGISPGISPLGMLMD